MKKFKAFSELWPAGPSALLEALRQKGFHPEISDSALESLGQNWSRLRQARSATLEQPDLGFFTYVAKDARLKNSVGWGLIFADKKIIAKQRMESPTIAIEFPDAAVDFVMKDLVDAEWTGPSADIPEHVQAEEGVVIGPDCEFAEGVVIEAGVRIGARVKIGRNTRIGAQTRIGDDTEIGEDCILTGLISLGGPGFGFVYYPGAQARQQRCHSGRVIIKDRVRLGALVGIDRGVFEDTRIESDVAIDNMVQIGHNSTLDQATTVCGFVAIAGSTHLGKNVTIGGMTGFKGHNTVGDNTIIAAWSGVINDVAPNQILKGYPLQPMSEALKTQVLQAKLPELYERIKKLEKALEISSKKS